MRQFLTIISFIVLYIVATRLAGLKRERPFGFQPPKKTLKEKITKFFKPKE